MKKTKTLGKPTLSWLVFSLFLALFLPFWFVSPAKAGGNSFSATGGGSGTSYVGKTNWFTLSNLVLTDQTGGSFQGSSSVLIEFAGQISGTSLQFDTTASSVTVTTSGTVQVTSSVTPTPTQISIPITTTSASGDTLTISGIKVKATSASTSSGTEYLKITSSGTAVLAGSIQVDLTGPDIDQLQPADGSYTGNRQPTISAHLSDPAGIDPLSVRMRINGVLVPASYDSQSQLVSYTPPSELNEAVYHVSVTAKDTLSNSRSVSWSFTIDLTPPTVSWSVPSQGAVIYGDGVKLSASASDATSGMAQVVFQYSQDQTNWTKVDSAQKAPYEVSFDTKKLGLGTTPAAGAAYYLRAVAYDYSGNSASSVISVTIDNAPPSVPSLTDQPNTNVQRPTLQWSDGTSSGAEKYHLQLATKSDFSAVLVDDANISTTSWTPSFDLTEGTYYWRVSAIDQYGNESAFSNAGSFQTDYTAPTISSITLSPPSPVKAGTLQVKVLFNEPMDQTTSLVASFGQNPPYNQYSFSGKWTDATTWQGTADISSATGDGAYTLSLSQAKDLAGNPMATNTSSSFIIDTTAPTVTLTTPNGGEAYQGGSQVNISWQISGDNLQSIVLYYSTDEKNWSKIWISSNPDLRSYSWTTPTDLHSQNVKIKVEVTDQANNLGEDVSDNAFTVDSQPPSVSLTLPTGPFAGGQTLNIQWNASDSFGLAQNPITLEYATGDEWQTIASGLSNSGSYSWTLPLVDSLNVQIRLTAVDLVGNRASATSGSFAVDSSAPEISSPLPVPGSSVKPVKDDLVTISALISDAISGVNTNSIAIVLNDLPWTVYSYDSKTGALSFQADLDEGEYGVELAVSDQAGHQKEFSWSFVVDRTAPLAPDASKLILSQNPPGQNDTIAGQSGAVEPGSLVKVYSDADLSLTHLIAQTQSDSKGAFPPIFLDDNQYGEIWVTATDSAGNESPATHLTNDITAPNAPSSVFLVPASPSNDNTPSIAGTVGQDVVLVEIQVDSQVFQAAASAGHFSYQFTAPLSDGVHSISVRAKDGAGNVSDWLLVDKGYRIDTQSPVISGNSPGNGAYLKNSALTIQANITDTGSGVLVSSIKMQISINQQTPISVTVDPNSPKSPGSGSLGWDGTKVWYSDKEALDGLYNVTISASDQAGNPAASLTFSFQIDTASPTVKITSPENGAYLSGTVAISASASDNEGGSGIEGVVFYYRPSGDSNQPVKIGSCSTAPYSVSWNTSSVSDGKYEIYALAYDKAGNSTSSASVLVSVDNTAPEVKILAPQPGAFVGQDVEIIASASDTGSGVDKVGFYYGGQLIGEGKLGVDGKYHFTWKTQAGQPQDGGYSLTAVAYDKAGNSKTSASVTVMLDNTPPSAPVLTSYTNPINLSNVASVSLSGTGEPKTTALIRFADTKGGVKDFEAPVDQSGHFSTTSLTSLNLSSLSDGAITLTVVLKDAAQNQSGAVQVPILKDTIAPSLPSLKAPSKDFYVNHNNVSHFGPITGSTEAGAKVELKIAGSNSHITDSVQLALEETNFSFGPYNLTSFPDGSITITVTAEDAVGNVSSSTSISGLKDTQPVSISDLVPLNQSNLSDDSNDNSYDLEISAHLADADTGSGINPGSVVMTVNNVTLTIGQGLTWNSTTQRITYTDSEAPDGPYYVTLNVSDLAGNSQSANWSFKIDTQPPAGSILINNNADYTNSATVTLNLSASDPNDQEGNPGSDALLMRFQENAGTWTDWEAYAPSKSWVLQSGDGTKTVSVQFQDAAGNLSAIAFDSIILDTTPPQTSLIAAPSAPDGTNGWYKTTPSLTFSATDNLSKDPKAPKIQYRWDNGQVQDYTGSFGAPEGVHLLTFWSIDNAQNQDQIHSIEFKVDTEQPTAVSTSDAGSWSNTKQLIFSWPASTDAISGIAYYLFYLSTAQNEDGCVGGLCGINIGNVTSYTLTAAQAASLSEGTSYYAKVKPYDNAGNYHPNRYGWSDGIRIDLTAPTIRYWGHPTYSQTPSIFASYEVSDTLSGLSKVTLYLKGPSDLDYTPCASQSPSGNSADGSLTCSVNQSGVYQLRFEVVDLALNRTQSDSQILVDLADPSSSAGPLTTYQTTKTFDVPYTASDNLSGLALVELWAKGPSDANFGLAGSIALDGELSKSGSFQFTASSDGLYQFYTRAKDKTGRYETAPSQADAQTTVDTTPPEPVTNLIATPIANGRVRLDWTKTTSADAQQYLIYRNDTLVDTLTDINQTSWQEPNGLTGTFTYTIYVQDTAGNYSTKATSNTVTTDATPPSFSDLSVNPTYLKANSLLTVQFTVSEELSSLVVTFSGHSLTCTNEGLQYTCTYLVTGTEPEGENQIQILATDLAGNQSSTNQAVVCDFTAPVISAGSPQGETSELQPIVSALISDSGGSGINPSTLLMRINGVAVSATFDPQTGRLSWQPPLNLRVGRTYYVSVWASDYAGNAALVYSFRFTIVAPTS